MQIISYNFPKKTLGISNTDPTQGPRLRAVLGRFSLDLRAVFEMRPLSSAKHVLQFPLKTLGFPFTFSLFSSASPPPLPTSTQERAGRRGGGGAFNNARHEKSYLARQSVLFFSSEQALGRGSGVRRRSPFQCKSFPTISQRKH